MSKDFKKRTGNFKLEGYEDTSDLDILHFINDNICGFPYTLQGLLDHLSILSWINLMAHSCNVGKEMVNIEERPWVQLPSGKKVVITIKIEEFKEVKINKNKLDHLAMSG